VRACVWPLYLLLTTCVWPLYLLFTTYYLRMAALLTTYYLLPAYGRSDVRHSASSTPYE
jgi:hypothetical protein